MMANIVDAMNAENEYLALRLNGIDANFPAMLATLGYTVDTYMECKREYQLRHLDGFVDSPVHPADTGALVQSCLTSGLNCLRYTTEPNEFIWHGQDILDTAKADALGISYYPLGYAGGNIFTCGDDLNILVSVTGEIDLAGNYLLKRLCNLIAGDAYIDANDIMIAGKKIAGTATYLQANTYVFVASIAFIDHSALIEEFGETNPEKPAGYISHTTKEAVLEGIRSWLL